MWAYESVFYQIYPIGFCGAPRVNDGITVPRKASAMAAGGRDVGRDALQAGDIVVFSNEIGGTADFVGIYIGSGQFVSCNNPSQPTSVQSLSSGYWSERFLTARRYGD